MAIAFDATSTSGFVNPIVTSTSWSHTVTGSNTYLMVFGQTSVTGGASFISGVTYNGVAMTQLLSIQSSAALDYLWYFYLPNASTGAHNIVVSVNSSNYGQFVAASYTGVAQVSPIDTSGTTDLGVGSGNLTKTLSPTVTGDWFISGYAFGGGGSTNPTSSDSTRRIIDFSGASTAIFDQGPGTLSNMTMTITPNITAAFQTLLGALVKAAPTSQILKVSSVAQASISKVSGVTNANIKKVSGVTNQ